LENPVPRIDPFYSANEVNKRVFDRIFHTNLLCILGQTIKNSLRRKGMGGYKLCDKCEAINREGR
jgi:hypothetical protein